MTRNESHSQFYDMGLFMAFIYEHDNEIEEFTRQGQ